ncbi:MAG: glycosyltransferase family 4 protein [Thermomicrobiales bacterium]
MKLLLIHQIFVSGREPGSTNRHYEFGKWMIARGDQLAVVGSQINYHSGKQVHNDRGGLYYKEETDGIEILRAFAPEGHHRSFLRRILAFNVFAVTSLWAGLRVQQIDVVMGTCAPIFQVPTALLVARLRRKPFVFEVRDLWPDFAIEMGVLQNAVLKVLARRLEQFLYRQADHILVNSPAFRDHLVAEGVPPSKISFVPNGVTVEKFNPADKGESIRARLGLGDKFIVMYAGTLGKAIDLETVINAAERLKDTKDIVVVLFGEGMERARLEQEIAARGLSNVLFAGSVAKDEMPGVIAAADVCIATLMKIPMFTMTYPNKVFEYMAGGRPTVLAIDGVIRHVVEEAQGGIYVPPGDPDAFAQAIRSLHQDPELRRRMGAAARLYMERHFRRETHAAAFRSVLEHVVSRREGART